MRRWRSAYFLAVPVVILVLAFQYPRLSETARSVFYTLSRPLLTAGSTLRQVGYDLRYNTASFLTAVTKQREYLARIHDLEARLRHYREMEKENVRLKKLLNFSQTPATKSIGARVIGQDVTPWRKLIVLDKGSRQGIKRDMVLVAPEGLVGRVLEAEPFTARAILLPDPDCRVSALTSQSRSQGVIAGNGTEKLQMRYLSLETEVAIGEDVMTSGIESLYPKEIHIGKVESIEKDSDGLHLLAIVTPAVSFSKLEEVLCLVSSPQK